MEKLAQIIVLLNSPKWGGGSFVEVAFALNLAATSWPTFQEKVKHFGAYLQSSLDAAVLNYLDRGIDGANRSKTNKHLDLLATEAKAAHERLWQCVRKLAYICAALSLVFLFLNVQHCLTLLLFTPFVFYYAASPIVHWKFKWKCSRVCKTVSAVFAVDEVQVNAAISAVQKDTDNLEN